MKFIDGSNSSRVANTGSDREVSQKNLRSLELWKQNQKSTSGFMLI